MSRRIEPYCVVIVLIPLVAAMMSGGCRTQPTSPPFRPASSASDVQPLIAHARRLLEAIDQLGGPFTAAEQRRLDEAFQIKDDARASEQIQHTEPVI